MIKVEQAIIVEGKYDKIRLASIIDGVIIQTNGYRIFKDKEQLELIRYYAERTGIIILTDSDRAGFQIRGFLKGSVPNGRITNVYIPDVFGKEKRKLKPSAEGKLGVEGIDCEVIIEAFKKAGIISAKTDENKEKITVADLFELGLNGGANSAARRRSLLKMLGLPQQLTTSGMLDVLNTMITVEELKEKVKEMGEE